jgi:hypothetical protein
MTSPTTAPAHALIESDRVEGTAVHDREGRHAGTIKRLMIDKVSGQVAYVVVAFAYLGLADDSYVIPWGKLRYDTRLGVTGPTSPRASCTARRASREETRTLSSGATRRRSCTPTSASRPTGGRYRLMPRVMTMRPPLLGPAQAVLSSTLLHGIGPGDVGATPSLPRPPRSRRRNLGALPTMRPSNRRTADAHRPH